MSNTKTIHWAQYVRLLVAGFAVASVFVMAKYLERDLDLQPGEALSAGLLLGPAIILAWTAWIAWNGLHLGHSGSHIARTQIDLVVLHEPRFDVLRPVASLPQPLALQVGPVGETTFEQVRRHIAEDADAARFLEAIHDAS